MTIRFLNITTPQEEYEIAEGSVLTRCKNETLDSAKIIITNTSDVLDLEPLDRCVLHDELQRIGDTYMCVDSINITELCLIPKIYRYDIELISETKVLEGYVLPNITITPSTGLTIYQYIYRFMHLYGPKYRRNRSGVVNWEDRISLSLGSKFNDRCPEMQWNEPTLREVITDLMMVKDCIPVVRNNVLYAMDLTSTTGRDISSDTHINYVQQSKSLEDYVSDLKVNLVNGMQEDQTGVNSKVKRIEMVPYTADSDYFVTSENVILRTEFPILRVLSLTMYFGYTILNYGGKAWSVGSTGQDLCNFNGVNGVFEEKQFRTLNRLISDSVISSNISLANYGKYQNFAVYYTRGSNEIRGFSDTTERRLGWISEKYTTNTLLKSLIMQSKFSGLSVDLSTGTFQNTFFVIEYETTANTVFAASKTEYPRNRRTVVDHQTNSYPNVYRQGFLEYQKANRLGNLMKQINARYTNNYNNLISIGDMYGDSIVFQTQYQIYQDHIEVNAQATKNYVLKDYFTGVKARIRSWKIVDGSEAETRHDLIKYYCELSYSSFNEIGLPSLSDFTTIWPALNTEIDYASYFCSSLRKDNYTRPIKKCGLVFEATDNYPSETNHFYAVEVCSRIVGNSLSFTFGCEDNFGVEKVVDLNSNYITFPTGGTDQNNHGFPVVSGSIGGIPLKDLRYVDEYGEFDRLYLVFGSNITKGADTILGSTLPLTGEYVYKSGSTTVHIYSDSDIANSYRNYYKQNDCTIDQLSGIVLYDKINLYKDNREITKLSYQFEFCSSDTRIKIGKAMLTRQNAIRSVLNSGITLKRGTTTIGSESNITLTSVSTVCCRIDISFSYTQLGQTIELRDSSSDELILSFVVTSSPYSQTLYLNFLKDRNKTIYDN